MNFIGVTILSILLRGYIFSLLWSWFMVTTFELRPLNIPQAIGISTLLTSLSGVKLSNDDKKPDKDIKILNSYVLPFVPSLLGLIVGWVVKHFL